MARNRETNETVALKKVRMENEKEGFPITAIREIKILKELHHKNVIQLKEIVTSKATKENKGKSGIYMVFEYMDHDLTGLMLNEGRNWKPTHAHIKCYMKQLLEGLHYCHANNVLHRDIKGSNLLINNKGELKLADFGLARPYTEQQSNYTNRVITLWYRPPELLLGAVQYGPAIDMWSAGCILAELLVGRAIFPGKNEIDQLEMIFKLCGTPFDQGWNEVEKMPWWHMFKPQKELKRILSEMLSKWCPHIPREALTLVERMLTLDPKKRISAKDALDADYFWTEPWPATPAQLPQFPSSHEYQAKKRRQQEGPSSSEPNNKRQKIQTSGPLPGVPPVQQPYPSHGLPQGSRPATAPPQGSRSSGGYPPQQQRPYPHGAPPLPSHAAPLPQNNSGPRPPSDAYKGQGPPSSQQRSNYRPQGPPSNSRPPPSRH